MNILIIEDEYKVAQALKEGLEHEGYQVDLAYTGEDGFFLLNTKRYDLLLLDLMLPGHDGIEVLTIVRKGDLNLPILIITARDTVEDRVLGLESGADDYLIKPFAFPELSARIRALLRRGSEKQTVRLKCNDLEMDLIKHEIKRAEVNIALTLREFSLLEYFLRHKRQILKENGFLSVLLGMKAGYGMSCTVLFV